MFYRVLDYKEIFFKVDRLSAQHNDVHNTLVAYIILFYVYAGSACVSGDYSENKQRGRQPCVLFGRVSQLSVCRH